MCEKEKEILEITDIDILGSTEFDLSEAFRDLFWSLKQMRQDIDNIKTYLQLLR